MVASDRPTAPIYRFVGVVKGGVACLVTARIGFPILILALMSNHPCRLKNVPDQKENIGNIL